MCAKITYEFWKKRSADSSVCSLSCEKSERNVILIDKPKREKPITMRTPENIAAVAENVREASSTAIHYRDIIETNFPSSPIGSGIEAN